MSTERVTFIHRFEVWDELNAGGQDGDFTVVEAIDAAAAAEAYADEDVDGQIDGLYLKSPQPISVRSEDGTVTRFHVRGEVEVHYCALEVRSA